MVAFSRSMGEGVRRCPSTIQARLITGPAAREIASGNMLKYNVMLKLCLPSTLQGMLERGEYSFIPLSIGMLKRGEARSQLIPHSILIGMLVRGKPKRGPKPLSITGM